MKRCTECRKLADSGDKRCQYCGTPFEYVTPYSEINLIFGVILIVVVGLMISNAIPLKLPDPSECSRTSYSRFRKIVNTTYKETKNILREEMLTSRQLSELMVYKYDAQDIAVPPCLEPAKEEFVQYLSDFYYIALYSVWGDFRASTAKMQSADEHWDALNAHLDAVKECVPNCP